MFNNTARIVVYACVLQPHAQIFVTPEVLRSPLVISEINRIRLVQNSTGTEFSGIIHTKPILMGLHQLRVPFTLQGYLKDLFPDL